MKNVIVVAVALFSGYACGDALTPGNLLTKWDKIYECEMDGVEVQSFTVPKPQGETVRDIVVTPTGAIAVFNGTFQPYMSICDPVSGTWQHMQYEGWKISNNGSYGGIAAFNDYVYVTDMDTGGTPTGIIRFNTVENSAQRFAEGIEFIDLTLGLDGKLYALAHGYKDVLVYDPLSFSFERQFSIIGRCRGIAVDFDGTVFGASWDGNIYRFNTAGVVEASLDGGVGNLSDIDISVDGDLVVGGRFGDVLLTDIELTSVDLLSSVRGKFVAFTTPVPEPLTLILLGSGGLVLRKKYKR